MNENIIDIIKRYLITAPVDVYGLADALGITIKEERLDDAVSGSLQKEKGEFYITVNSEHSGNRKRFTIAHEIGHFILHDHLIGEGIYDNMAYRSDDNRKNPNINQFHETEANRFAASILMPEPLINDLRSRGIRTIPGLAAALGVSQQAMRIRMESIR